MLLCACGRGHVLLLVVKLIVAGLGTANQLGQRVLLLTNKYKFKYIIFFLKNMRTIFHLLLALYDIMLLSIFVRGNLPNLYLFKHLVLCTGKLH